MRCLFLILLILAQPAVAQTTPESTMPSRAEVRSRLADKPIEIETLGLKFLPIRDSLTRVERKENTVTILLTDASEPPIWSLAVQPQQSTLLEPSAAGQISKTLESWRAGGRRFTVLRNEPFVCHDKTGQLCLLSVETVSGGQMISGWLILPFGDRDYLAVSIQARPETWDRVRPDIEACLASIRIRFVQETLDIRRKRLERGRAFLESLDEPMLRALLDDGRWFRHYLPNGPDGRSLELGCLYVEIVEAPRGSINPVRTERMYDPDDEVLGFTARTHSRHFDGQSGIVIDSQSIFWMAWDQSQERWSVRTTRRAGGKKLSQAETGMRSPRTTGDPTGHITVIESSIDGSNREERHFVTPEVYLSQPLRWALGRLLPKHDEAEGAYSYYFYDGAKALLAMRTDQWSRLGGTAPQWQATSRSHTDAPETISVFDGRGTLIRQTLPDGSVLEPIELDALHRLWKQNGLPTGGLK